MGYLRPNIAGMAGYVPGFQPPDEASWIKLNTNENPYPPSPQTIKAIQSATGEGLRKYPGCRQPRRPGGGSRSLRLPG